MCDLEEWYDVHALPQGPPSRPKAVSIVETGVCLEDLSAQSIGEENLAAASRECVEQLRLLRPLVQLGTLDVVGDCWSS